MSPLALLLLLAAVPMSAQDAGYRSADEAAEDHKLAFEDPSRLAGITLLVDALACASFRKGGTGKLRRLFKRFRLLEDRPSEDYDALAAPYAGETEGCDHAAPRVMRGGSWHHRPTDSVRSSLRYPADPSRRMNILGFRPMRPG